MKTREGWPRCGPVSSPKVKGVGQSQPKTDSGDRIRKHDIENVNRSAPVNGRTATRQSLSVTNVNWSLVRSSANRKLHTCNNSVNNARSVNVVSEPKHHATPCHVLLTQSWQLRILCCLLVSTQCGCVQPQSTVNKGQIFQPVARRHAWRMTLTPNRSSALYSLNPPGPDGRAVGHEAQSVYPFTKATLVNPSLRELWRTGSRSSLLGFRGFSGL